MSVALLVAALVALAVPERRRCAVRGRCEPVPSSATGLLTAAGPRIPAAIGALLAAVALAMAMPALVVVAVAVPLGHVARSRHDAAHAARARAATVPQVLEDLGRHLRAGGSIRSGVLELAADLRAASLLGPLAAALRHGAALPVALQTLQCPGIRNGEVQLVRAALMLGADAGGPHARALDCVATTLRERASLAAEVHALGAQARASAAVLTGAPLAFGLLGAALQPEAAHFVLREPAGAICVLVGVALLAAGWWWMRVLSEVDP